MALFKKDAVNVSITDQSIRYLVCPNHKNKREADYGEMVLDANIVEDGKIIDHKKLMTAFKKLVDEKRWKGRKLHFIVPDSFVTMRSEQIPASLTKEEAKSYIKLQLEGSIRLPFKNPLIDFHITKKGEQKNDILLFAYPEDRLQPFYELFTDVSLKPQVADLSFLSIYRIYAELDLSYDNQHLLMIQWNTSDLVLTVFHKGLPIFNRHINFANMFDNYITSDNNQKSIWYQNNDIVQNFIEDQFVTIERFMDFYQYSVMNGNAQITDIVLTGDVPVRENIHQQLLDRFELLIHPVPLPFDLNEEYSKLYGLCIKGKKNEGRIK
ncbi:type IV pilus biogenesis protein PilM [Gracilibacillus kekensis]|uniref:Type IV pilus assembly protein PilM n=1 Tax=Gracilibacillus kekensis TaxID=1027249 RepID=A0A1M7NWE7_9BACI|nr:pilus assembly protein PilM [Gracilibacillus kekensis]SHN08522.1 type IV pilus assembly protein PilM [Gracilibacillus kekensis]